MMGLEVEFPCAIHRMAAGPSGALLVQLDDWIMAVEPGGRKRIQAHRNGGETLVAPWPDGRALVMTQDRRLVVCAPGEGATLRAPALCNVQELVPGDAYLLGARVIAGGKQIVVLIGVTPPRAETNIECDVRGLVIGTEDGVGGAVAALPSMGPRVPRVWGVDEKRGVIMAGSLPDCGACAMVSIGSGERLADGRWLGADERGRVVCSDSTSAGRWCLSTEQEPDPDGPEAPPVRKLHVASVLGKEQEIQLVLEPLVGEVRAVSWSPDGATVAVRTDAQIWRYRPGEKKLEPLCGAGVMTEAVWWFGAGGLAVAEGKLLRVVSYPHDR